MTRERFRAGMPQINLTIPAAAYCFGPRCAYCLGLAPFREQSLLRNEALIRRKEGHDVRAHGFAPNLQRHPGTARELYVIIR
jgi:hypothetical protein